MKFVPIWLFFIAVANFPALADDAFDAGKVIGFEQCHRCHKAQVEVLSKHAHFLSGEEFHKQPAAIEMAERLGHRSVKRTEACIRCHYTPQRQDDSLNAIAGISCESCHGPAQDWLAGHNDYGGPNATARDESAEHRQFRIQDSIAKGMCHPSNPYLLAKSCFRCHVVDDEAVVNQGQHQIDSPGFEFVAWSQGAMRHNFFRSGGRINEASHMVRQRLMYVVGVIAELEGSLHATSKATYRHQYAVGHAKRVHRLRQHLQELAEATRDQRLQSAAEIANQVSLDLENAQDLRIAAERIGEIGLQLGREETGQTWEAVDRWLPTPEQFQGQPMGRYTGEL